VTEIDVRWAWSRVEAAADGSLSRADMRRMRRAIESDPDLEAAVERAMRLRAALRTLGREPVPASLTGRLLEIRRPGRDRASRGSVWSWASAAGAAGVLAFAMLVLARMPAPQHDERVAALREFELAMTYLHRSYAIAGEHVRRRVGQELAEALSPRRGSRGDETRREENGG